MLLAEAAPTFIKAHDSIIRGVVDSPHKRRILEMLSRFAKGTHAEVIAEGVEREDEAEPPPYDDFDVVIEPGQDVQHLGHQVAGPPGDPVGGAGHPDQRRLHATQ